MSIWNRFGLLGLCFLAFQSCGAPQATLNKSLVYSFGVDTDFFYDIKLISKTIDDVGRHSFVFDVVVSYAPDFSADVNYSILFSTLGTPGVCLSEEGVASGAQKHFRASCLLPKPNDLFVQVNLSGPESSTLTKEFQF